MLKPAVEGSGVIAGGSARAVLELAGYKDIKLKFLVQIIQETLYMQQ